jgi:hypothetical protein
MVLKGRNHKYMPEEMAQILSHKGNTNQNNIEIPSHPNENGMYQESKEQQMLARM